MVDVVIHEPSGRCRRRWSSRRPRRIQGLQQEAFEVLGAQSGERETRCVRTAFELGPPGLREARPQRTDEQHAVSGHGQGEGGEEREAFLRREVQIVDQDHRRTLRRQGPRRVDEHGVERLLGERLRAGRRRLAPEQGGKCGDQHGRLGQDAAQRRLETDGAEVLPVGRRERARPGSRTSRRVRPEQEIQFLAVPP